MLAEQRVEAERILAALDAGARGRRASCSTRDEREAIDARARRARGGDARRRPPRASATRIEALDVASKPFAERRMNRAIARAHRRHAGRRDRRRRSSTPRAPPSIEGRRTRALMPKVTFRARRQSRSRCRRATSILEAAQEGARAGRLRLRRRLRLLDLPRLREGGPRLAVRAAENEEDILDKAFDVRADSRLGCQSKLGATRTSSSRSRRESRQAWLDEHPEERAKLKQNKQQGDQEIKRI